MEKSTKIYIGVGIGAIVLGYLYLKRKQTLKMLQEQAGLPVEEGQESGQESSTPTASGGGGGGGAVGGGATASSTPIPTPSLFAPLMSLVTPVAVTPTTSTTSTPTVSASTPIRTPPSIGNVLFSATPNISPVVPVRGNTGNTFAGVVRPTITTTTPRTNTPNTFAGVVRPTMATTTPRAVTPTVVTPTVVRPTLTAVPSGRSGFNGMNNESFELGDCLTDL